MQGVLSGSFAVPFYPALGKAFGTCGALLVQQVHYWASQSTKVREDRQWVYNTYSSWASQLGFSERTVRTAVKNLEALGVLVVGVFNKSKYDRTRWYAVDYERLCQVLADKLGGKWKTMPHPSGSSCHIHLAEVAGPIPDTTADTTAKSSGEAQSSGGVTKDLGEDQGQQLTESDKMKAKDLLKDFAARKQTKHLHGKHGHAITPTVTNLSMLWKSEVSEVTGSFCKPLTIKEKGQLRMIIEGVGLDVAEVLRYAVRNWGRLVYAVTARKGVAGGPEQPHIGYLLKHYDVAMQLIAEKGGHESAGAPSGGPPPSTMEGLVNQAQAHDNGVSGTSNHLSDDAPATAEDIAKILATL